MSVRISLRVLASATNSVRWVGLSGGSIRRSTLKISIPLLVRVVLMRNHSVRWVRSRWPCGKVVRGNAGYQCVIERIRIVLLLVGIQFVHILTASTISGRVGVDRVGSTGGLFEERIGKVGGRKVDGFLAGIEFPCRLQLELPEKGETDTYKYNHGGYHDTDDSSFA